MYVRLTGFLLCLLLIMAAPCRVKADTVFTIGSNTYQQDGKSISIDVKPQIINNRTMVPVRYLAESCGADVLWDPNNLTVTIKKETTVIQLTIGSSRELISGSTINMDVAPAIVNGRTMLPARWVAEKLGLQVVWSDLENTVTIFPQQALIQANFANVRTGPGMKYDIIGFLPQNTVINVREDVNNWYQFDLPAGKKGWLAGWLTADGYGAPLKEISLLRSPAIDSSADVSRGGVQPVRTQPAATKPGVNTNGNLPQKLLSGLGVWTSIYEKLPDSNDLSQFSQAGIKRIYLEVATTDSGFPQEWQSWIDTLVPAAHKAGIQVIGWAYTSLKNPENDKKLVEQVAGYRTPGGDRLDAVAADIEDLPENDTSRSQLLVQQFAQVRPLIGCPLLAITYPPQIRPQYPYDTIINSFDGVVLMDYWHVAQRQYSKDEVTEYIDQSVAPLKQINPGAAIDIALEGCDIGGGMVTADEMQGAVEGARSCGTGYSLYCYDTPDRSVWTAFAGNGT